jgi:hypothetical protein
MARMTTDQRLSNVHADALKSFSTIQSALRDERLQCLQDRRFYSISGAQWEGPLSSQFENKPKLEVNKIALIVSFGSSTSIGTTGSPLTSHRKDGQPNDKLG